MAARFFNAHRPAVMNCEVRHDIWWIVRCRWLAVACCALFTMLNSVANAQSAKIVGLGATSCERFATDTKSNPLTSRDYLAWTQGFMSGILLSRPAGIDEGLDLNPTTFGLLNQLHFLEDRCAKNPSLDFSDAG